LGKEGTKLLFRGDDHGLRFFSGGFELVVLGG